jgi:site-specific DNA recombinase
MRVALYARVSSESQEARGTIGSQIEVLRARITTEGHELVAEFCDDGFSGARLDRPALDAMRDQAEAGNFDAIWCLSPDRLARAYVYQVLVLDELAQFGVKVLFCDAPALDDDPQLRLLTQVQGVIAEYERAKIAERNRRGRLYRSRAGEVVSWKAPYGYRRLARDASGPARLEVFEPEAEVVRRIFDDYVNGGHSIRQIVRQLNTDGILTPTGKSEWWHSTVCRVLRNEAFIGRVYYNQTETVPTTSRTGRHSTTQRRRPREEWIAVPCPSILDEAIFEAAQNVSRDNSSWSPRNLPEDVEAWLLRRLVRCGACQMTVGCQKIVSPQGKVHRYYWCPNHARARLGDNEEQRCPERNIRSEALDAFVFEQVRSALLRPDVLLSAESAITAATPAAGDEILDAELARIDRKIEANRAERRRLADLYQSGLLELADVQRRARDVDSRLGSLAQQREGLISQRQELAAGNLLRQRVSDFAQRATASIDTLTFSQRQQLLRLVVEHVRVTGWQVEIQLRIPLDDPDDSGSPGREAPPGDSGGSGAGRRSCRDSGPRRGAVAGRVSTNEGLRSLRGLEVPHISGEPRQEGTDVFSCPVPADEGVDGEGVSKVMYARRHGRALPDSRGENQPAERVPEVGVNH